MVSNEQTKINNERKKMSDLAIAICRQLYISGMSGRDIEQQMRSFGFEKFSVRILYPRNHGRGRREGWIREFGWNPTGPQASRLPAEATATAAVASESMMDEPPDHHDEGTRVGERDACGPVAGGTRAEFIAWLKQVSPDMTWDWKYQEVLYDALDRITRGENKRLMINIPPRHGKSELVTVRYLAWRMLNNPSMNIILASYGQSLANRFSRKIRQVISDHVANERSAGALTGIADASSAINAANTCNFNNASDHNAGGAGVADEGVRAPFVRTQVRFRCAACRAEAAARRSDRRGTACVSKNDRIQCPAADPDSIDECSKCGGPIDSESEPPALEGDNCAAINNLDPQGECGRVDPSKQTSPRSEYDPPANSGGSDRSGKMFPFTSSKPINTISEWGTAAGGGLKAVGVGAGVTGFGADLIMIDDPVKNRAQAESETYRERLWDWYTDDLYTRLEPEGSVVIIQTRWHEDDLAGRLINQMKDGGEKWEIVNLPAIAETGTTKTGSAKTGTAGIPTRIADASSAVSSAEEGTSGNPNDNNAGGTGAGKRDACGPVEKPRVIGYPRLYSKLSEPPALACGRDAASNRLNPQGERGRIDSSQQTSSQSEHVPPANAGGSDAPDWRVVGEALCPPRYDVPKLAEIKDQLGTYAFSSLYQQRPTPAEGTIFRREWLKNIVEKAPPGLKWFRGYDLAISTRTTADYTASLRIALDEMGVMYIADGFRKRIEYPEQRRLIFEKIMAERDTQHGIEDSGNARAIMSELRRQRILLRWPFRLVPVVADKTTRALTWAPRAEEGKLRLVRGAWIDDFTEELIRFPFGQHDDQVDAVSVAAAMMGSGEESRLFRF